MSVAVEITDSLKARIEDVLGRPDSDLEHEQRELLERDLRESIVSIQSLKLLDSKFLDTGAEFDLKHLLLGSKLVFPKARKAEEEQPNSELIKRRQYLRLRQESKLYNAMVEGTISNTSPRQDSIRSTLMTVQNQASIIVNMIVAILATFGIFYYVGSYYTKEPSKRLVYGLIGAVIIMFVEMFLYIIRACQMEYSERSPDKAGGRGKGKGTNLCSDGMDANIGTISENITPFGSIIDNDRELQEVIAAISASVSAPPSTSSVVASISLEESTLDSAEMEPDGNSVLASGIGTKLKEE